MLPNLIYAIVYGLGRAPEAIFAQLFPGCRATDEGSVAKVVRCEQCTVEYVYQVRRRSQGGSVGFLVADHEAAARSAAGNLKTLLSCACEPVPCPKCGWLQRDMVRQARQLKYRGLLTAGVVLFLAGCILLGAFMLVEGIAQATKSPWVGCAAVIVGLLALGAAALAAVLLVLRFLLPWFYDPNTADVEGRIALGRSRAVSKQLYESGAIVLSGDPTVQINEIIVSSHIKGSDLN